MDIIKFLNLKGEDGVKKTYRIRDEEAYNLALSKSNGVDEILTDNLFDKTITEADCVFYYASAGVQLVTSDWSHAAYVPLRGAGTYRTKLNWSQHESTGGRIALVKEDNTYSCIITGTYTATNDREAYDFEFVVTQEMIDNGAAKIAFDCSTSMLNNVMIVKDRAYPTHYIPYSYIGNKVKNIFYGKTALFFGDSICAGTTVPEGSGYYGYGWGGLIGEENGMAWGNYGKNGGVVTHISSLDNNLWLSKRLDTAFETYKTADYVIFEGGCNDGDTLGEAGLGTISSNFTTFDTTTFSGAFESFILKVINTYPTAKIGYLCAPKMGLNANFGNNIYRKYFDRAVEICKKWGVPVLDLWNESPLNPMLTAHYDNSLSASEANANGKFYTDGQHLTLAGYQQIKTPIEEFMRRI